MRKELLIVASIMFSLKVGDVQAACTETPNCTELGFTKTANECKYGSVKCPWNTGLVYCKERRAKCQIGWIYYNDETCSADVISGKTPLGVVVYVSPNRFGGQVMSAWPVDESGNKSNSNVAMKWGGYGTNIPNLPDYTSDTSAVQDFDSCGNTDKIIAYGGASTYPPAWAARSYAPTAETKGKWCLPAAGVLISAYNNQSAVQAGISKLGGIIYPRWLLWSSTEVGSYSAWYSSFDGNSGLYHNEKYGINGFRPVLEF